MSKKVIMIDPGKVVDIVNKKNPEKRQVMQKDLATFLGVSPQHLTNLKKNPAPQILEVVFRMREFADCKFEDFITETQVDE